MSNPTKGHQSAQIQPQFKHRASCLMESWETMELSDFTDTLVLMSKRLESLALVMELQFLGESAKLNDESNAYILSCIQHEAQDIREIASFFNQLRKEAL